MSSPSRRDLLLSHTIVFTRNACYRPSARVGSSHLIQARHLSSSLTALPPIHAQKVETHAPWPLANGHELQIVEYTPIFGHWEIRSETTNDVADVR